MAGGNPLTRRTLCIGVGATVAMAGLGALRYVGSEPLVRPPGGQDEENLVSRCVHCYRCIEACPEKVIVAASLDAGVLNMRTPRMEFSDCYPGQLDDFRYCDFCAERNGGVPLCAAVCPSGALQLPVDYAPETEVIGVAVLNTETCIAYRAASALSATTCASRCVARRMRPSTTRTPMRRMPWTRGCPWWMPRSATVAAPARPCACRPRPAPP